MATPKAGDGHKPLRGLKALVTGGGTGIGKGIASALAASGCSVAIAGRRLEVLEQTARELSRLGGVQIAAVRGDLATAVGAAAVVGESARRLGTLHIVVNNAGVAVQGPFGELTDEDVDRVVDIDLKGPIHVLRAALPHLSRHREERTAAVLNVSSSVTLMPLKNYALYSAAKAGIDMLTRCLALELAAERIRVNAVCPGVVDTAIFAGMLGEKAARRMLGSFHEFVPLGRVGRPEDVGRLAVTLCDPRNDWLTGAVIPIDGGLSLGPM